jgi:hypothetical protein
MSLTTEQKAKALQLRSVRPAVLPNTNAIYNTEAREAWHGLVTYWIDAVSLKDKGAVADFCDLAGVAT